jgi:hypothetical protein
MSAATSSGIRFATAHSSTALRTRSEACGRSATDSTLWASIRWLNIFRSSARNASSSSATRARSSSSASVGSGGSLGSHFLVLAHDGLRLTLGRGLIASLAQPNSRPDLERLVDDVCRGRTLPAPVCGATSFSPLRAAGSTILREAPARPPTIKGLDQSARN